MKININYVLPRKTIEECKQINRYICQQIPSCEINFEQGLYRPHVTLLMGEIEDSLCDDVLKTILNVVSSLKFFAVNKKVTFSNLYFKNNYIMCDVQNDEQIINDNSLLISKLGNGLLKLSKYQISNGTATPHITLGYCSAESLPEKFLEGLPKLSDTILGAVVCAEAGKHGTVLISSKNIDKVN